MPAAPDYQVEPYKPGLHLVGIGQQGGVATGSTFGTYVMGGIALEFEATSAARQANSLHKLDTLIEALTAFRAGLAEEFALYDEREAERERLVSERAAEVATA